MTNLTWNLPAGKENRASGPPGWQGADGSGIDEQGGELEIPLDFLTANRAYAATFYEDAPASHYIENREAYRIRHGAVNRGQRIVARLAPGGGHCMWIRPREPVRK